MVAEWEREEKVDGSQHTRAQNFQSTNPAFDAAFLANYQRIRDYVSRRTITHEVDDVVAETFTVAWRRWDEIPTEAEIQSLWLIRTARLTLLNFYRSNRRRNNLQLRLMAESQQEPLDTLVIDEGYEFTDSNLGAIFGSLSDDDQEILALVAWEGCSIAELAIILESSHNAAKMRLQRVKDRVRELIRGVEQ